MVDKKKLKAAWVAKGYRQSEIAQLVGVSAATFSRKMNTGKFGVDEAKKLIEILDIENPSSIFFAS